jgi:hypothetical protein
MAATVDIYEWNGTSGSQTSTSKTSGTIRYKNADNATVDLVNPMVKPGAASYDRSWKKFHRLHIGGTGPTGEITNVRFYTDGGFGTGYVYYGKATPTEADGTGEGSTYPAMSTYTSGSPLSLGAGPYTGTNTDIASFLESYLRIDENVPAPGLLSTETWTFAYDET